MVVYIDYILVFRAKEQLELSKLLEDEKLLFYQEARELKKNLSDVKHQKVGRVFCVRYMQVECSVSVICR